MIPQKWRWVWLLISSLFFFWKASGILILFILASSLVTFVGAILMTTVYKMQKQYLKENSDLTRDEKKSINAQYNYKRKWILAITIVLIAGQLLVLKYNGFFIANFNSIMSMFKSTRFSAINFIMPLGISFYTIFCIGYCIDIFRGQYDAQSNFLKHILIIAFFPNITQGPIERYDHLSGQIFSEHHFDFTRTKHGIERMIWGYFKKMVIADNLSVFVSTIFNHTSGKEYGGCFIFLAALLYTIQIYADFSGYVDIALGFSETLGIKLLENFKAPYLSKDIAEFWRRWHISLGAWFKDYVFYSILRSGWCQKLNKYCAKKLPKNVAANLTTSVGLFIIWIIIGFWHGSSWKFIFYGLYYGSIIIFSTWMNPVYKKIIYIMKVNTECFSYRLFQIVRTFLLVTFGYILFCSATFSDFLHNCKLMVTGWNPWILFDGEVFNLGINERNMLMLFLSTVVLWGADVLNVNGHEIRKDLDHQNTVFRLGLIMLGILAILIFGSYGTGFSYKEFIYQQF